MVVDGWLVVRLLVVGGFTNRFCTYTFESPPKGSLVEKLSGLLKVPEEFNEKQKIIEDLNRKYH